MYSESEKLSLLINHHYAENAKLSGRPSIISETLYAKAFGVCETHIFKAMKSAFEINKNEARRKQI